MNGNIIYIKPVEITKSIDRRPFIICKHPKNQHLKPTKWSDQPFYRIPGSKNNGIQAKSIAFQHLSRWITDHLWIKIHPNKVCIIDVRFRSRQHIEPKVNLVDFPNFQGLGKLGA